MNFLQSPFAKRLALLLVIDTALSFVYAAISVDLEYARAFVDLVQFGFMTYTMWVAVKRVLEEY